MMLLETIVSIFQMPTTRQVEVASYTFKNLHGRYLCGDLTKHQIINTMCDDAHISMAFAAVLFEQLHNDKVLGAHRFTA